MTSVYNALHAHHNSMTNRTQWAILTDPSALAQQPRDIYNNGINYARASQTVVLPSLPVVRPHSDHSNYSNVSRMSNTIEQLNSAKQCTVTVYSAI